MKVFLESICLFYLIILSASITYAAVPDIVLSQKKAVVTIYVYEGEQQIIFGSGFIIDPTGIIVTNYHVISTLLKNPNTSIAIKMEDSKFIEAEKLIIFDEDRDIALIKVRDKNIPAVNIAPDYDNQGNVLDGVDKTSLTLRPIVPDSIAEALFIIVCQNK